MRYAFLFIYAGIIFEGDSERLARFKSAKNLIETGLMGEKSHSKI